MLLVWDWGKARTCSRCSIQHRAGRPSLSDEARKGMPIRQEEIKLSLLADDDLIVYTENSEGSPKHLLRTNKPVQQGIQDTHTQSAVFTYMSNGHKDTEVKAQCHLQTLKKNLGATRTQNMQKMWAKNCKMPMKEIREAINKRGDLPGSFNVVKMSVLLKLTGRFNTISIKTPAGCFFVETDKVF